MIKIINMKQESIEEMMKRNCKNCRYLKINCYKTFGINIKPGWKIYNICPYWKFSLITVFKLRYKKLKREEVKNELKLRRSYYFRHFLI